MVAQRYGQRPSDLVGIADPVVALDFDIAIALKAVLRDTPNKDRPQATTDFTPIIKGPAPSMARQ